MCHWSSYEHERRLRTEPTRPFFQALRDLFRRRRQPQAQAPEAQADVIPLPLEATRRRAETTERADAA